MASVLIGLSLFLSFFETEQKLRPHCQRNVADLSENECAPVCLLESPEMTCCGSGERPLFMSKEFTLD